MIHVLPRSLFGRMVWVLLGGLFLAQALNIAVHLGDRDSYFHRVSTVHAAQRIADMVRVFDALAPEQRRRIDAALHLPRLRISLDEATPGLRQGERQNANVFFRRLLRHYLDRQRQVQIDGGATPDSAGLAVRVRLRDGT